MNDTMALSFEDVRALLKQRFPMLMVDTVSALEAGRRILAHKNVTGNEIQFLGHFPEAAVMPGTLMVEGMGQAASILFSHTTELGLKPGEFLVLGLIQDMRFLVPVVPGDRMDLEVKVLKLAGDLALVEAIVRVADSVVAKGRLGFGRRTLASTPPQPGSAHSPP